MVNTSTKVRYEFHYIVYMCLYNRNEFHLVLLIASHLQVIAMSLVLLVLFLYSLSSISFCCTYKFFDIETSPYSPGKATIVGVLSPPIRIKTYEVPKQRQENILHS